MRIESFKKAKPLILEYLISQKRYCYTEYSLKDLFYEKKDEWNIASYRRAPSFISFLIKEEIFEQAFNENSNYFRLSNVDDFYFAQDIVTNGYLSYFSALKYHQLTQQIPRNIYISWDRKVPYEHKNNSSYRKPVTLSQESIDHAFSKKQRKTSEIYLDIKTQTSYHVLRRKSFDKNIGILHNQTPRHTDIERTLIDIAVRPAYSGGIFQVIEAYKASLSKIKISKVAEYLDALDYIYPYHQLIGLYFELAGVNRSELSPFIKKISPLKFYLTYNMQNYELDKFWNVYYPSVIK